MIHHKHSVAALVYRQGDHLINVFVWPASRRDEFAGQMLQDDGFHILFWTRSSTNYCAISDLEQGDSWPAYAAMGLSPVRCNDTASCGGIILGWW